MYNQAGNITERKPSSPISYLTGLLGALLGALIGAIPWYIVSTHFDFFVGYLGFLIGICAFFGYKLFRGARNTVYAIAIVILCAIFALLLSMYASCFTKIWDTFDEYGVFSDSDMSFSNQFDLVFKSTNKALAESEVQKKLLPSLLVGLGLGLLGVFSMLKSITGYTKNKPQSQPLAAGAAYPVYTPQQQPQLSDTQPTQAPPKDDPDWDS